MTTHEHFSQHNTPGASGNVYANQGGTQNFYAQEAADHFRDGLEALKHRLYPKALDRFENYLSTASRAGLADSNNLDEQVTLAAAHVYAALALLSGAPPSYRKPEEVDRINKHLAQALRVDMHQPVHSQAGVLWAIVKDDYYEADGMPAPPPDSAQLRTGLNTLASREIHMLVEHLAPAKGVTWQALKTRAAEFGIVVTEPVADEVKRGEDSGRATAVRKYFTPTPELKQSWPGVLALCAAGLLVIIGFSVGGFTLVLCFAGAFWSGRWGFREYKGYLQYVKDLEKSQPKPSDVQMDSWLHDDVEYIKRKAARRLRLNARLNAHGGDLVVPEQVVIGIPRSRSGATKKIRMCRGQDNELRANVYDVVILFLTDNLVSAYRGLLDFENGNVLWDETHEYHYKDIVGVSSTSIPMPKPLSEQVEIAYGVEAAISLAHQFHLSVTSGESLDVETGYSGRVSEENGKVAWRNNDHALNVIQKLVRARHNA